MKKQILALFSIMIAILLVSFASAASLSLSLGSYDSEIYTQETVDIPVTITASNITGSTDVTLTPKSGLSCSTCTLSYTFTGASSETGTVTFTLTGTQTGTYNPPFTSISATSGSTAATPLSSGSSVTVVESPTWVRSFTASDSTPAAGDLVTLALTITPSGTFQGVSADLSLTGGLTLVSGSDPRTIGTISGVSSYQWTVRAASSGTASVALTATDPSQSASSNIETVTLTVPGGNNNNPPAGGGGGGGTVANATNNTNLISPATPSDGDAANPDEEEKKGIIGGITETISDTIDTIKENPSYAWSIFAVIIVVIIIVVVVIIAVKKKKSSKHTYSF